MSCSREETNISKRIVLCLDGTGNEIGDRPTNVLRLFSALHKDGDQLAYYDPGVGTFEVTPTLTKSSRTAQRALGLAFGLGLRENIVQAYSFLVRHYESGDTIAIFGFSRGAYTARVVASLVAAYGILRTNLIHLIPHLLRDLEMPVDQERLKKVKRRLEFSAHPDVRVEFLGLWDTVSSVSWAFDPLSYLHVSHNPKVAVVRHAVSLDERRAFFRTNLVHEAPEQNHREVWFTGVHSDIGGGYNDDSSLAMVTLEWMMTEARDHGLDFNTRRARDVIERGTASGPNALGRLHRSLKGPWWLCEVWPKRPWIERERRKRFHLNLGRRRRIPGRVRVHQSVLDRVDANIGYDTGKLDLGNVDVEPWRPFDAADTSPALTASSPHEEPVLMRHRVSALATFGAAIAAVTVIALMLLLLWSFAVIPMIAWGLLWPFMLTTWPTHAAYALVWPIVFIVSARVLGAPLNALRDEIDGPIMYLRWRGYSREVLETQLGRLADEHRGLANFRLTLQYDFVLMVIYAGTYLGVWRLSGLESAEVLGLPWPLTLLAVGTLADVIENVTLLRAAKKIEPSRRIGALTALIASNATRVKCLALGAAVIALTLMLLFARL